MRRISEDRREFRHRCWWDHWGRLQDSVTLLQPEATVEVTSGHCRGFPRPSLSLASRLFKRIYLKNNSLKMLPSSSQRGKRGEFGTRPPPTNRYFLSASGAALLSRLTSPFWTVLSKFIWPRIRIIGGKQHLPRQRPQYSGRRDKANTNPLVKPSRSRLQRGGSGGTLVSVFTTSTSPSTPVTPPPQ